MCNEIILINAQSSDAYMLEYVIRFMSAGHIGFDRITFNIGHNI